MEVVDDSRNLQIWQIFVTIVLGLVTWRALYVASTKVCEIIYNTSSSCNDTIHRLMLLWSVPLLDFWDHGKEPWNS
jgi:hypothetical protein